ncbi:MAG: hypothetical protein WB706_11680 [Nitrososphaeraceae archaeon]
MSNERFATRGNSLIGDTIINYNLPIPMNSSTSNHPTNSRDMKNMVNHNPFPKSVEPRVYVYNAKISNWEIEELTALESDEPLQFKIKTFIIFEYGQDKQNLTLDEFDSMTTHFIEELESKNVTIFSRSLGHKGNTVELGVIARDKTITSELIRSYSMGFKNLGVNKILILSLSRYNMSISI